MVPRATIRRTAALQSIGASRGAIFAAHRDRASPCRGTSRRLPAPLHARRRRMAPELRDRRGHPAGDASGPARRARHGDRRGARAGGRDASRQLQSRDGAPRARGVGRLWAHAARASPPDCASPHRQRRLVADYRGRFRHRVRATDPGRFGRPAPLHRVVGAVDRAAHGARRKPRAARGTAVLAGGEWAAGRHAASRRASGDPQGHRDRACRVVAGRHAGARLPAHGCVSLSDAKCPARGARARATQVGRGRAGGDRRRASWAG